MKEILNTIDKLIFLLTEILFSLIPVVMILGGSIAIFGILLSWYYQKNIIFVEIWYILFSLLVIAMGFKWFDIINKE